MNQGDNMENQDVHGARKDTYSASGGTNVNEADQSAQKTPSAQQAAEKQRPKGNQHENRNCKDIKSDECKPPEQDLEQTIEEKLAERKKQIQKEQAEAALEKQLSDCKEKKKGELNKLINEIEKIIKDYTNEKDGYDYLKKTLDCMKNENKSRYDDIPDGARCNLENVIREIDGQIELKWKCIVKIECLSELSDKLKDKYKPAEWEDKWGENFMKQFIPFYPCEDATYDCDEKTPIPTLCCTIEDLLALKSVKQAADDLEKSKKNHDKKLKNSKTLRTLNL
jgi:hypothetical protein